jgi:hypothetical protein
VRQTAAVRIAGLYVEDNEGRSLADPFRRHRRVRFLARGLRRRLTVATSGPNYYSDAETIQEMKTATQQDPCTAPAGRVSRAITMQAYLSLMAASVMLIEQKRPG